MKQLIVNVPDNKIIFFKELLKNLGFTQDEKQDQAASLLSEKQIDLIRIERKKIKEDPEYLLDWEENKENARGSFIHF